MNTTYTHVTNPEFRLAERLATLLDNQFKVGKWSFGLDAIIDLLPIGGDTIVLLLSFYLIYVAFRMKVPTGAIIRMLLNIGFAFIVGLVPVRGDVAYLAFKPNMRNLEILRTYA
jgi:hypothetical protein